MNGLAKSSNTAARTAAVNGISIALVFIATAFINVRLPIAANGGLIHLGNVPLFLAAAIFGKKTGAICGAFGALFPGATSMAPAPVTVHCAVGVRLPP